MSLPSDHEDLVRFYMYLASAQTLTSVHDLIAEIQTFQLDQIWPVGSAEYMAVANILEAIKLLVVAKQNKLVAKSQELLD